MHTYYSHHFISTVLLHYVSDLQEPSSGCMTDIFSQPDQQNMGSQYISKFMIYSLHLDTSISDVLFVIKVKLTAIKTKSQPLVVYIPQKNVSRIFAMIYCISMHHITVPNEISSLWLPPPKFMSPPSCYWWFHITLNYNILAFSVTIKFYLTSFNIFNT